MKHLFLQLLFILPGAIPCAAQLVSPDSVFFLERKSLQYGDNWRKWTGDLKSNTNTGFVWRISTGYWSDMRQNLANVVPVTLDGAWKWHFLETGLRLTRTVAPVGTDIDFFSPTSSVITAATAYPRPLESNMHTQGAWWYAGVNLPIGGIPIHFQYGRGVISRPMSNLGTVRLYYSDGKTRWVTTNTGPVPVHRRGSNMLNLGFSKGAFFGGVQYASGPGPDTSTYSNTRRMRFANVHIGLQMSTGATAVHPDRNIRSKTTFRRFDFGISSFTNILASRYSTSSIGLQAHAGWHFNSAWSMTLTHQWSNTPRGYSFDVSKVRPIFSSSFEPLYNKLALRKASLVSFSRAWNRMSALYWYATGGGGLYRYSAYRGLYIGGSAPAYYDDWVMGAMLGGGFRYRWIFSQVLMHGVWDETPYFYGEWSIGAKLSI